MKNNLSKYIIYPKIKLNLGQNLNLNTINHLSLDFHKNVFNTSTKECIQRKRITRNVY